MFFCIYKSCFFTCFFINFIFRYHFTFTFYCSPYYAFCNITCNPYSSFLLCALQAPSKASIKTEIPAAAAALHATIPKTLLEEFVTKSIFVFINKSSNQKALYLLLHIVILGTMGNRQNKTHILRTLRIYSFACNITHMTASLLSFTLLLSIVLHFYFVNIKCPV